ncbi:Flagellar hook-associated protein 2 [Candidatus Sulfotelmatomonas gaucii]|uniref:Flagellar hook-associated protein 2 n=1 Tax=Candidatus Sulfuritelmatomonas gaucii TaxID=2043161 RepID=A0A2N9LAL5_9BACT|nr:Flagellar hook-associated protein 2 [Candidatus Sulfotelmatomonas gaucii]
MGTVGLSFGSPTSGAGFNVSSTVSEIVGNLENVETPWKNQLTSLESQDTAISNLGTLFSNLSNDASALTDFQGVLAQKEGSSSDTGVLELTAANSTATAGTHTVVVNNLAQTASGYLDEITNASDALAGSLTIQMGNGTAKTVVIGAAPSSLAANTIYTGSGANTLPKLASAISSANLGVTANVLTDSSGSRLSLVSNTSGSAGKTTITSQLTDAKLVSTTNTTGAINYNSTVGAKDASLVIDGVPLTSASNTVTNLIPGVTFQLLAPSAQESDGNLEPVQVVISNDNSGVESAVNHFVTDYNALIKAVNTQEGYDSTGKPEPLFGSPTVSLLQQQLLSSLNTQSPNGYLDGIAANNGTTLSGSMTIQVGNKTAETIVIGAVPSSPAANTIYTGSGSDFNTLSGLANAISAANIGVTAGVATSNGESTLTLTSQTAGANGALGVTSAIVASAPTAQTYVDSGYTSTTADSGTLGTVGDASDTLTGSISIRVGNGTAESIVMGAAPASPAANTIYTGSGADTLSDVMDAINNAQLGVSANLTSAGTGITLTSSQVGAAGALAVASSLADTTSLTNTTLNYNNSSDINSLTALGVSVNNDGSLTLDANALDSLLNSDYNSLVGFFQNANSWGQTFSTMLTNAGSSSSTGILALAAKSNSNTESTLNAEVTKEDSYIATQKTKLTAELNQANQIMQQLPSELNGMNELYSAITGYNQGSNG